MTSKITLFLILAALWFGLSGFFKPLFIFFGISSTLMCIFFYSRMQKAANMEEGVKLRHFFKLSFFKYLFWLVKEIIISSFKLAIEVWKEKPRIRPETVWIKHDIKKEMGVTLYANSITLTPGTVSIHTAEGEILVHAVHTDNIKDLQTNEMCRQVKKAIDD